MLVGAPVDNVTYQFGAIQQKFGAVYRCLYKTQNTPSDCQYIPIDDSRKYKSLYATAPPPIVCVDLVSKHQLDLNTCMCLVTRLIISQ